MKEVLFMLKLPKDYMGKEFCFSDLRSCTVSPEEISVILLEKGENLRGINYTAATTEILVVDRCKEKFTLRKTVDNKFSWSEKYLYATGIRQIIPVQESSSIIPEIHQVNANKVVYDLLETNKKLDRYDKSIYQLRKWAEWWGDPLYVPGGITPVTDKNTVVVPDFKMSGTNWHLLPTKLFEEFLEWAIA